MITRQLSTHMLGSALALAAARQLIDGGILVLTRLRLSLRVHVGLHVQISLRGDGRRFGDHGDRGGKLESRWRKDAKRSLRPTNLATVAGPWPALSMRIARPRSTSTSGA